VPHTGFPIGTHHTTPGGTMKAFLILASFLAVTVAGMVSHAASVVEGPLVDLTCKLSGKEDPSSFTNFQVREVGPIVRANVPANVPAVFMESLIEDQYQIREFKVTGQIRITHNGETLEHNFQNHSFYGSLSFPDIGDGFDRTAAYNDYDPTTIFRAITIEQSSVTEAPSFALYRSAPGYATSSRLDCAGTMPAASIARPGVVPAARYDRELQCVLAKGKTYPAAEFSIKVTNLQNPRLTQVIEQSDKDGKTGWFVHGEGMDEHILGRLNDGDAQILRSVNVSSANPKSRLVSKYFDECGGFDCFMIELDLAYPQIQDTEIRGHFRYREDTPSGDYVLKDRSGVRCSVKEL